MKMFNYCVGRPWPDKDDGLSIYCFHNEVHHGTMKEAKAFCKYVDKNTKEKNFIYKLVKMEE